MPTIYVGAKKKPWRKRKSLSEMHEASVENHLYSSNIKQLKSSNNSEKENKFATQETGNEDIKPKVYFDFTSSDSSTSFNTTFDQLLRGPKSQPLNTTNVGHSPDTIGPDTAAMKNLCPATCSMNKLIPFQNDTPSHSEVGRSEHDHVTSVTTAEEYQIQDSCCYPPVNVMSSNNLLDCIDNSDIISTKKEILSQPDIPLKQLLQKEQSKIKNDDLKNNSAQRVIEEKCEENEDQVVPSVPLSDDRKEKDQGVHSVPLSDESKEKDQGVHSIPLSDESKEKDQGVHSVPLSDESKEKDQGVHSVPLSDESKEKDQGVHSVPLSDESKEKDQGVHSVPLSDESKENDQGVHSVPLSDESKENDQGVHSVPLSDESKENDQGVHSVPLSDESKKKDQGVHSVPLSDESKEKDQGVHSVPLSDESKEKDQGVHSVPLSDESKEKDQGVHSVPLSDDLDSGDDQLKDADDTTRKSELPRKSSKFNEESSIAETIQEVESTSESETREMEVCSPEEIILQKCQQKTIVPFTKQFPPSWLENCEKIGEGTFAEVFCYKDENRTSVFKIMPVEGDKLVNEEPQKKYKEILPEILISLELSSLRKGKLNKTDRFAEFIHCMCVNGRYPDKLIELWNEYSKFNKTENDSPSMFQDDQVFIVLELAHGGKDMDKYCFNTAEQAVSVFIQITYALAVAETSLQFEHRDLHWGNILISETDDKTVTFSLNGGKYNVPTKGVLVTIIDFTLSRMTYEGIFTFTNLSTDETLFEGQGDYQFDMYRQMRDLMKDDDWSRYVPRTNVLWLHYIVDKMRQRVKYKCGHSRTHRTGLEKLNRFYNEILSFESAVDIVKNLLN